MPGSEICILVDAGCQVLNRCRIEEAFDGPEPVDQRSEMRAVVQIAIGLNHRIRCIDCSRSIAKIEDALQHKAVGHISSEVLPDAHQC